MNDFVYICRTAVYISAGPSQSLAETFSRPAPRPRGSLCVRLARAQSGFSEASTERQTPADCLAE